MKFFSGQGIKKTGSSTRNLMENKQIEIDKVSFRTPDVRRKKRHKTETELISNRNTY